MVSLAQLTPSMSWVRPTSSTRGLALCGHLLDICDLPPPSKKQNKKSCKLLCKDEELKMHVCTPFIDLASIKLHQMWFVMIYVYYWSWWWLIGRRIAYFAMSVCIVILERHKQMAKQRLCCEWTVGLGNVPAQKNNKQYLW